MIVLPRIVVPLRNRLQIRAGVDLGSNPAAARREPAGSRLAHPIHHRQADRLQDARAGHRVGALPRNRIARRRLRRTPRTPGRTRARVRLRTCPRRRRLVAELGSDRTLLRAAAERACVVPCFRLHTPAVRDLVPAPPNTALARGLVRLPAALVRAMKRVRLGPAGDVRRRIRAALLGFVDTLPLPLDARRAVHVPVAYIGASHGVGHGAARCARLGIVRRSCVIRGSSICAAAAGSQQGDGSREEKPTYHERKRSMHGRGARIGARTRSVVYFAMRTTVDRGLAR